MGRLPIKNSIWVIAENYERKKWILCPLNLSGAGKKNEILKDALKEFQQKDLLFVRL
jgi:hypothetical protein